MFKDNSSTTVEMGQKKEQSGESVTAVEYIKNQDDLEKEAREIMPYDPVDCTYTKGPLRQPVFACLTCSRENEGAEIGLCYSCSIQCHSTHELVELFAKRRFVCDCGTSRMAKTADGYCKLRRNKKEDDIPEDKVARTLKLASNNGHHSLVLPADDIPSSSNCYNQNYQGNFCSCERPYNPVEETANMIQCYFGAVCGEDWYHDECILGFNPGTSRQPKQDQVKTEETNKSSLPQPPAEDKSAGIELKQLSDEVEPIPNFPDLESFDLFICWKCVNEFKHVFDELEGHQGIIYKKLPHFSNISSVEEWENKYESLLAMDDDEHKLKKPKLSEHTQTNTDTQYSVFLALDFRQKLESLAGEVGTSSPLHQFLKIHDYLYLEDPVYEFPEEEFDNDDNSSTSSIYLLGADALSQLPRDQALDGLQAYEKISNKLKEFFKPFAEQGKVVTEDEVREFFGSIKKE